MTEEQEKTIDDYVKGLITLQEMSDRLKISIHECNVLLAARLGLDLEVGYY